ncbi:MAG: RNA polymerase sigma factor [Bacteroidaceae bacterium]|nr:RNA polymerase sigma factor [Bacteroidaceae bacterium]
MTRLTADDFNRLYREHARRAQGFFLRMTGDSMLAEDLTQELFTRLWEHRSRFDARQGEFTTWMFSVAYNLCKNEYRHRSVARTWDAAPTATEYVQDASAALEREEKKKLLAEAVQHLPDGIREVFLLRYEEELPISDVAQILRIPEGTVKSRAYTALKTLQQQMKQY